MAITTSPDNIPSPTSGDPYNYVVDMAALADGTQDALTQKANMGVGTSTQRTAALGKFPDGALWYDTTTSSEWRRVGGAWVNQDTGWVTITPNAAYSTGTNLKYRRIGQRVQIQGSGVRNSGNLTSADVIATLPGTVWPAASLNRLWPGNSSAIIKAQIQSDGDLFVNGAPTASTPTAYIDDTFLIG